MTVGGSQNLRLFRQARRNGHGLGIAAEMAGMSLGEARLTEEADAANPPPEEAFEPITTPQVAAQPRRMTWRVWHEWPVMKPARRNDLGRIQAPRCCWRLPDL
jgi:hypothetical protein